ncbi:hypothetical protein D9619_002095 [Psilocybe cf. subviscida]|uniref:Uncharacterized protein n=1 Tax=Psilocybe cf. subviscida TaxID=2480587 RepID=A0A8H5BF43_9AGAR|nr:hypothetical protein D9619_002095 [Psilocybe cf. subviscida]
MADGSFSALHIGLFDLKHSLEFFLDLSAAAGCVLLDKEDNITAFDSKHLIQKSLDPNALNDTKALSTKAAANSTAGTSQGTGCLEGMGEVRAAKKRRTHAVLGVIPDGDGWVQIFEADAPSTQLVDTTTRPPPRGRLGRKPQKVHVPLPPGAHKHCCGRGGIDRSKGKWYQLARGDPYLARLQRLLYRSLTRSDVFQNLVFNMISDASPASTGWQGFPMADRKMDLLRSFYNKDEVSSMVRFFLPVYYVGKSTMLLDREGRCFAFRTAQIPFLQSGQELFHTAVLLLLAADLASWKTRSELTAWHRSNMDRVDAFMKTDIIKHATAYVSRTVKIIFPGVAERMARSAKWQGNRWGIKPMFGVFYNLCINGIFPHQKRIHCEPHLDFKNIVGVCALLVYQDPRTPFNHRLRSWVVLWEAGVAIELPPWVVLIYPSSLLHHYNVDVLDFKFVTVDGTEWPTPENSTPIVDTDGRGRGTFVYFNQSSMYQSAETDSDTLADATRAQKETTVSYSESVKAALEDYSYVYHTTGSPPPSPP